MKKLILITLLLCLIIFVNSQLIEDEFDEFILNDKWTLMCSTYDITYDIVREFGDNCLHLGYNSGDNPGIQWVGIKKMLDKYYIENQQYPFWIRPNFYRLGEGVDFIYRMVLDNGDTIDCVLSNRPDPIDGSIIFSYKIEKYNFLKDFYYEEEVLYDDQDFDDMGWEGTSMDAFYWTLNIINRDENYLTCRLGLTRHFDDPTKWSYWCEDRYFHVNGDDIISIEFLLREKEGDYNSHQSVYFKSVEARPDYDDMYYADISPSRFVIGENNDLNIQLRNYLNGSLFEYNVDMYLILQNDTLIRDEWTPSTSSITWNDILPSDYSEYTLALNCEDPEVRMKQKIAIPILHSPDLLSYVFPDSIPIHAENLTLTVFKYDEILKRASKAKVSIYNNLTNEYSIDETAETNFYGEASFDIPNNSSYPIYVDIEYFDGTQKKDTIIPYFKTTTSAALGKNNQTNLVRESGTNNTAMLYSVGDTMVFAKSYDFGETWFVDYITYDHDNDPTTEEVIATGTDPVITELTNGYMIVWKDGLYLKYATKTSPWIVDTLNTQPTLWHSEGVLSENSDNTMKYGGYINHRTLDPEGELIFSLINPDGSGILSADTMMKKDGSDGAIPKNSPFVAGYIQETDESYLAGCIDMSDRVAYTYWDISDGEWKFGGFTNTSNNPCLNPSINFNGSNTTFVWEEINDDNTKDIWDYKITPNGTRGARNLSADITPGINRYAKNSDNILYNYINNANTMIDYRDGISSDIEPRSYTLYEGSDSLHSYAVNVKKEKFETYALYSVTEGRNGNYRIKFINKRYGLEAWPKSTTEPTDTAIVDAKDSPISDYVNGNFKVERLSVNIPVIDNNTQNMIRLTTDDRNPHIPQVVMIDSEVMGVIYGGNAVKETDIEILSYMRDDNVITVTIDRQKGNPNRTIEIALYEYETENTQPANNTRIAFNPQTSNHKLQTSMSINHQLSTIDFRYSIPKAGNINFRIFDASGRIVETVRSGIVSQGNYTYTPKASKSGVYFAVMEYEGKVYKEKFVILK